MKAYYQISKYNKDNELIKRSRKYRSKSFVKAFLVTMYRQFSKLTYGTLDTSNTLITVTDDSVVYYVNACTGNFWTLAGTSSVIVKNTVSTQIGIVVGTGTNAVATTDYALQTLIANGVAATQLEYGAMYVYPVTVSAPNATLDIERIFRNSIGGTITIKELGIYYKAGAANNCYYYCMVRDLSTIAVLNGEYLKITYTFQITA